MISGLVIFHEAIGPTFLLALALVVSGAIVSTRKRSVAEPLATQRERSK